MIFVVFVVQSVLESLLSQRILVLDGAMGTLLQQRGFTGNFDHLSITRPDAVSAIHHEYLDAGSDIIQTNTFNSTDVMQADFGLASAVYDMNVAASRLAKAACQAWTSRTPHTPRFVAGTIGPTNRSASPRPNLARAAHRTISFGRLREAYKEQARGLIDGGCDLLLVETVFDLSSANAAIAAIHEIAGEGRRRLPLMLSVTIAEPAGRMPGGASVEDFWTSVAPATPLSVGLNCSAGARAMRPHLEVLARVAACRVSCHPSAGLPNARGEYEDSAADLAAPIRDYASRGLLNIAGGCCGTTPEHVRAIAAAVSGVPARSY